jgi:quercetin dioxygenase-like cupin family protein
MKKPILFVMIVCFCLSCNQNTKVSQNKETKNDSSGLKNEKKATLDIDALNASPDNFKLLLDNQYVRVLEYNLNPGKKDEWHTHPAKTSYVASGGQLKVYLEKGEIIMADEDTGTASWMDAVGKHYVENVGKTPIKIILTEIKSLENSH